MLFSGTAGLYTYDGIRWTSISSYTKSLVRSFWVDSLAHRIYCMGTKDLGYLEKNVQGTYLYQSISDSLEKIIPHPFVGTPSNVVEYKGEIFFQAVDFVVAYHPKTQILRYLGIEAGAKYTNMFKGEKGLYLFTNKKGLFSYKEDKFVDLQCDDIFKSLSLSNGIIHLSEEKFVISGRKGELLSINIENTKVSHTLFPSTHLPIGYENDLLYQALKVNEDLYLFGFINSGVCLLNAKGDLVYHLNAQNGLKSPMVLSVFKDKQSNIWLGTSNGLSKISEYSSYQFWLNSDQLKGNVTDMLTFEGKTYIATDLGLFYLNGKEVVQIDEQELTQLWFIKSVEYQGVKSCFVGGLNGLFELTNGKISKVYEAENVHDLLVWNEHLVLGTAFGLEFIKRPTPQTVSISKQVKIAEIRSIIIDKKKDIWVATRYQGVYRFPIESYLSVNESNILSYADSTKGIPDPNGILSFDYQGEVLLGGLTGLLAFDHQQDNFHPFCGLGEEFCSGNFSVFDIKTDASKWTWILPWTTKLNTPKVVIPTNEGQKIAYKPFKLLPKTSLQRFYIEDNRPIVWVASTDGVFRFNRSSFLEDKNEPFSAYFSKILIGKDSLIFENLSSKTQSGIVNEYPYALNHFTFHFGTDYFIDESKTTFSYKLDGIDDTWSEWTNIPFKEFTNLQEGSYTFRVRAKNVYDQISDESSITFVVKPPLLRHPLAYCAYVLCIVGLFIIGLRWNSRRLKKENLRLEAVIHERTQEILNQNSILEKQSAELKAVHEDVLLKNIELEQQKEEILAQSEQLQEANHEIQRSYQDIQLLSEIGKEITSILDNQLLIKTIHSKIKDLMSADAFGIGLYSPTHKALVFEGFVEKNEILPTHRDSVKEVDCLSAWCFIHQKDILMNNVFHEYSNFFPDKKYSAESGEQTASLIYTPLHLQDENIGVLTIQSFKENAYAPSDVLVVKTLATYIAIAMGNAQSYRELRNSKEQITDSIRYAQTIQQAILPLHEQLSQAFGEFALVYKPKDLVSGDFYWHTTIDQFQFLAVVDCTGHGVPGAFMSMIANTLLNEITKHKRILDPSMILEELDRGIRSALKQNEGANQDGMDLTIARIDQTPSLQNRLCVASAKANWYLFNSNEGQIQEFKGVRRSIGGKQLVSHSFENVIPELCEQHDYTLYLFSDGYLDQGNKEGVRIMSKGLKHCIELYGHLSLRNQEDQLLQFFNEHKGKAPQRDDVTLLAVHI